MKRYLPKFRLTNDATLKDYEVQKIRDGLQKEYERQQFWKLLTSALLFAFACVAILVMMGILR